MKYCVLKTILIGCLLLITGCVTSEIKTAENEIIFYPELPQRPRLQFLQTISSEDDLGKETNDFKEFLLGKTVSYKRLEKPYDIGSSPGKLFILDKSFQKLIVIDLIKKKINYLKDHRLGALSNPSGIWISKDETKYIADMKRKQVVVFGPDDNFLRVYGNGNIFERPVDVAVFKNKVYISDMLKNTVSVMDRVSGSLIKTIGKPGTGEGEFYKPTHLTIDHLGNLFVNDAFNYRIQKFDSNGTFVTSFGQLGDTFGSFARPKGIAIDHDGHLYAADAAFENVQIFDQGTGKLLFFFGGSGTAPGSMYLPAGIHIDYDNVQYFNKYADKDFKLKYIFYVLNTFGDNKINVYGFGDWIGEPLSEGGDQ